MKRWQIQGVVLDSDDEELSIATDFSALERPQKRARHRIDDGETEQTELYKTRSTSSSTEIQYEPPLMSEERNGSFAKAPKSQDSTNGGGGLALAPSSLSIKAADSKSRTSRIHKLNSQSPKSLHQSVDVSTGTEPSLAELSTVEIAFQHATRSERGSSPLTEVESLPDPKDLLAAGPNEPGNLENNAQFLYTAEPSSPLTDLSSPLSERQLSPPPEFQHILQSHFRTPIASNGNTANKHSGYNPLVENSDNPIEIANIASRRSLRARKEVQLHPYLVDRAQYIKQCKQRGLKPMRFLEEAHPAAETQYTPADDEHENLGHYLSSSQAAESQSQHVSRSATFALDYFDNADEASNNNVSRPKLRRFMDRSNAEKRVARVHDEFSPPPSPRRASDTDLPMLTDIASDPTRFKLPFGVTPAQLATPETSSGTKSSRQALPTSDSNQDLERLPANSRRSLEIVDVDSTSAAASESEGNLEAELSYWRKKLRGVLPASWLKIDLRTQMDRKIHSPIRKRKEGAWSSRNSEFQKGVARKIARHQSATAPEFDNPTLPESEGESDVDQDSPFRGSELVQRQFDPTKDRPTLQSIDLVDENSMEQDWVDPMLAASSRSRQQSNRKHRHQRRITDAFQHSPKYRSDISEDRTSAKIQSRLRTEVPKTLHRNTRNQRPRQRRSPVHLSIVDSLEAQSGSQAVLPQYVKLALRRARSQINHGRHSPTNKSIRLATEDDTREACSVLNDWRERRLVPRSGLARTKGSPNDGLKPGLGSAIERDTLLSISHNARKATQPSASDKQGRAKKAVSKTVTGFRKSSQRQRKLEHMITNDHERSEAQIDANSHVAVPPPSAPVEHYLNSLRLRNAQIETEETDFNHEHRAVEFERRMRRLAENVTRGPRHPPPNFQMARFLNGDDPALIGLSGDADAIHDDDHVFPGELTVTHRPRKPQAQRLDAEAREYRQPIDPLPQVQEKTDELGTLVESTRPVLQGIGAFGTNYSIDFDVRPLEPGTFFQAHTFIGSGDFEDALKLSSRDLDVTAGRIRIHANATVFEWSSWTDDVASDLRHIPSVISAALETADRNDTNESEQQRSIAKRNIDHVLRSVTRYCSKCLWFVDPVDRQTCVASLRHLTADLNEIAAACLTSQSGLVDFCASIWQYTLVIAKQALQLCEHSLVLSGVKDSIRTVASQTAECLARLVIKYGLEELRSFYEDNRHTSKREAGIDDDAWPVNSLVILRHTLQDFPGSSSLFWQIVNTSILADPSRLCKIAEFEKAWYDMYTVLPTVYFDASGLVRSAVIHFAPLEDWSLVRGLTSRVTELYDASSQVRGLTANSYVRAILSRCYHLVNSWGWWRCEQILSSIYDFFAGRGLALLRNEDNRGSPGFLDRLEAHPSFDVEVDDCAFHICLKLLATGLQNMRKHGVYPNRKIGSIAWRFIPSHGRTYQKDRDLRQSDLDALRNHFDLLCTLYFASPPDHRFRIELLRNLVDHSTSHREACSLSIRAWTSVASFQASVDEPMSRLQPLTEWFCDMMRTTLAQYRLARSEAELDFAVARERNGNSISQTLLYSTVARNQRQVAASFVELLAGLKRVISSANSRAILMNLIQQSSFWILFDEFNLSERRLNGATLEALGVAEKSLELQHQFSLLKSLPQESEDSQDFGDDTALSALVIAESEPDHSCGTVEDVLLGPIGRMLSNAFGSDETADDSLLQRIIELRMELIRNAVQHRKSSWTTYIDDYSAQSWFQMRDTIHKRKFTSYFMSCIVQHAQDDEEIKQKAFTVWMVSLVEREALLKFQHVLTSTLLNQCREERLVQNLPFIADRRTQLYEITLQDLRLRRLHLISCLLSNMRENFEDAVHENLNQAQALRSIYADMIRQVMQAMKKNYQELQASRNPAIADINTQGAYVEFVQHVVSLLQQHTTAISPVDRFFTDSSAFPLPAMDPTYVVGKLRSYVPKLSESKTRKELAMFIQSVCERAAVDGQQEYMVNQISTAVNHVHERGDDRRPSLRYVLMTSIISAYTRNALSSACSWILALPLLEASERILRDLLYTVSVDENQSVAAAATILATALADVASQCELAVSTPVLLQSPSGLRTMTALFVIANSCLTPCSWIHRCTGLGQEMVKSVDSILQQAVDIKCMIAGERRARLLARSSIQPSPSCPWPDTISFTEKQLRDALDANWYSQGGSFFMRRGNAAKEIVTNLDDLGQERTRLLSAIDGFCNAYDAVFNHQHQTRQIIEEDGFGVGNVVVLHCL